MSFVVNHQEQSSESFSSLSITKLNKKSATICSKKQTFVLFVSFVVNNQEQSSESFNSLSMTKVNKKSAI